MRNANYHHSTACRQALMLQLNSKLKQLFPDGDFKNAAPYLFGENFGTLAKEHLEAAEALKKTLILDRGQKGFYRSHPQKNPDRGGWQPVSGRRESRMASLWQQSQERAAKEMTRQHTDYRMTGNFDERKI